MDSGNENNVELQSADDPRGSGEQAHAPAHAKAPARAASPAAFAFVIVALVVLVLPWVGMLWAPTTSTSENRTLAAEPSLVNDDGSFNVNVLSDAGSYFEDHFAFRNALVSSNAFLRALVGSSATDQVVVGSDGWLYYGGSLYDYLGQNHMTDRALQNAAHNLALLQGYAASRGARFVFTIAPSKNTLYPENMPYYYERTTEDSNWNRLVPYLEQYQVNYVDLFDVLGSQDDVLYYKTDTHWTNRGALIAANALLTGVSHGQLTVADRLWTTRADYTGDLFGMLYPDVEGTEEAPYVEGVNDGAGLSGSTWSYTSGEAVTDSLVTTTGAGEGSLLMYRDSFGNALIPYMSTSFASAQYSKLVPYSALEIDDSGASCVVVERAERHLSYLAAKAPIMLAPSLTLASGVPTADDARAEGTTLTVSQSGPYYVLDGVLDEQLENEKATIYVAVEGADGTSTTYEAFTVSHGIEDASLDTEDAAAAIDGAGNARATDYGYTVYLDAGTTDLSAVKAKVFVVVDGVSYGAKTFSGLDALLKSSS